MKMPQVIHFFALMIVALSLPGCPQPPLPPPISINEQMRQLNEWSALLPGIKAKTVLAGVRLDYRDDQDQPHSVNAEGLLQIRQHLQGAGITPPQAADVLLLGKSFDQPAFEAGRNATNWWFAIRLNAKKAWVGDATRRLDYATLGSAGAASILRADLVPDLLGLSQLPPTALNRIGSTAPNDWGAVTMMLVDDETGMNDLYVGRIPADGQSFLSREILVDRRSGHVVEVRLYDPAGIIVVRSRLRDYRPVSYEEGAVRPEVAPKFPRKVEVSYPAQQLTIALEFADVKVATEFSAAVFRMPDFEQQGLQIIPAD